MKRLLLAAGVFLVIAGSAQAQLFGGGTCTTAGEFGPEPCTGIIEQSIQVVEETITEAKETLNTIALGAALFQDATGLIGQLTTLVGQADMLANNPATFINNLLAPDYPLPNNGYQQWILHSNTVGNAIQTLGQTIDTKAAVLTGAAATINSLSVEALAAIGRLQTQQDLAQIEAAHTQEHQAMQDIHMAEMQAHHSEMLARHDRQAMADKWGDMMATAYQPLDTTAAPGY